MERKKQEKVVLASAKKDKTKRRLRNSRFGARVRGTEQPQQGLSQ